MQRWLHAATWRDELDVEMPELNGIEALAAIRKTHPRLPIIMFGTFTERRAASVIGESLFREAALDHYLPTGPQRKSFSPLAVL